MADFINTIDLLGDDVVVDSIIQRTITEFKDDKTRKMSGYSLAFCEHLSVIELPELTELTDGGFWNGYPSLTRFIAPKLTNTVPNLFSGAKSLEEIMIPSVNVIMGDLFNGATALTKLDLHKVTSIIGIRHFIGTNLTTLIIRTSDICSLGSGNCFSDGATSCPIHDGAGYIYVPRSLVDSYKAATNWSVYANQFRALEDYTVDGTVTGELDETKI